MISPQRFLRSAIQDKGGVKIGPSFFDGPKPLLGLFLYFSPDVLIKPLKTQLEIAGIK